MYIVIDDTHLPCQMRLHDDNGQLRGKKDVLSMQDAVHEVIDGSSIGTIKDKTGKANLKSNNSIQT